MHTASKIISFPSVRRFALAAGIALLATLAWMFLRSDHKPAPRVAQDSHKGAEPEMLALSAVPAPPLAPGTKRALLVAIEGWPEKEKDPKHGCAWHDAMLAKKILMGSWGFAEKDIVLLHDGDATTHEVVSTFQRHLVAPSQPDDVVVIYWTSHGTRVKDFYGEHADGLDGAYCTFDFSWDKPETWFTHRLLRNLLAQLRTKHILVITDACHSGSSLRGVDEGSEFIAKGISSGFTPIPDAKADARPKLPLTPEGGVYLAACRADELSYGAIGKPGIFTQALFDVVGVRSGTALT